MSGLACKFCGIEHLVTGFTVHGNVHTPVILNSKCTLLRQLCCLIIFLYMTIIQESLLFTAGKHTESSRKYPKLWTTC